MIANNDTNEDQIMHSKNDNIEIMINDKADEVIKELFKSILDRYQIALKITMKGNNFVFDCVDLLQMS